MHGNGRCELPVRQIKLLAVAAALWLIVGCGTKSPNKASPDQFDPRRYGKLPGLSAVPVKELRDELARIVEEGGTPEQLSAVSVPDRDNVAAGLEGLFEPEKVAPLLAQADEIYPPPRVGFRFDPIRLQRAISFRKTHDERRMAAREALRRPKCDFGVDFMAGQVAELPMVDLAWLLSRLEAFQAAEQLQDGDLDGAIETVGFMLRIAECLGAEKHVVLRGQGALLREDAMAVLDAIVRHRDLTRDQLATLEGLVADQLAHWPPDADAWIGDRAQGMHSYELVRDGKLLQLLLEEDVERFGGKDVVGDLPKAAQRTVNEDELYYLKTMRRVIDSCRRPYYERVGLFEEIRADLQARKGSAQFPLVAAHLLLLEIEKAHAIQAHDRALCEAWALALTTAIGKEPPDYTINPRTGLAYRVVRDAGRVEVSGIGPWRDEDDRTLIVPDFSARR